MIGQTISHYKILEKLGEGGMGVVYKAHDTKLNRDVALKFLPSTLTSDPDAKERFVHEAQAASALDHPNICNIHEIDETAEGQIFIAMAYYEGETLKKKIERGPLKIEEALDIAIQITQGLAKAHEQGIVHRDLKPANIMIASDGAAKIVDFGLAKLSGRTMLTRTGSTLGTAAYSSPEQARGEEVDMRSDIFSTGVVLYEMLTARLPFRGDHEAALLYSIVHEEPQAATTFRSDIPRSVVSVIEKALQKDRQRRYQTTQELIGDLKVALMPRTEALKKEKSIVVLPFENLSPDPEQEYFSDGLTEEVISDLSAVSSLLVISRSSAMTFKRTKKKVPEIARELDVQYVLEGSVRKAGNSLRITSQLIDATSDVHLWAEKYSGTLDDVFAIQEKVSRAIVEALKLKLTPDESRKIAARPIDNVAAYQCYLKASAEILRFTESALDSARLHLQKALDILDENPLLYSAMALVYWQYVNIGAAQEDYIDKAEEYARKALSLDADCPQAYFVLGMSEAAFHGRTREAIRTLKRAIALDPNYVDPLKGLSAFLAISTGDLDTATALWQRFKRIDPIDSWNHMVQGVISYLDGQYERATDHMRLYYQSDPDNPAAQFFYAWYLMLTHRFDEAFSIVEKGAQATPENACTKFGLIMKHGFLGERELVQPLLTPDFIATCKRDHHWSYFVAFALALNDAKEEALDWLENAVNFGFINYRELERNPFLKNIRDENRFKELMERVKKEREEFDA